MEEFYPLIRNQINDGFTVYHLIFAHQWGEFYRKDGVLPRSALENCLNLILTKSINSAYDFCLKVWSQSLKTLYFSYRADWVENIFKNHVYQNLGSNEKASFIVVSLCASIDEFNYLQGQNLDQSQAFAHKRSQVHRLYNYLITDYENVQSPLVKMWILQTFIFLREQEISQASYTIGLSIEMHLKRIFEDIFDVFQSSSNPIEQALALDFILSSRIEEHIRRALRITFELIGLHTTHDRKLLSALLIDVFCRIDLENLMSGEAQQQDSQFAEFCQDPFAYICHHYHFSDFNLGGNNEFSLAEDSWVCSAILRRETSASAHKYFLPTVDTISVKSLSYNYMIGDSIGGNGVRYNLPNQYKNSTQGNDWWSWRIKDDDGDVYTLYSCQVEELTISHFVNEYFPMDSGFVLFKNSNFSDGLYLYNSTDKPFWGGAWAIEEH
ncbi:hypothetical protein [Coleofasciculus sp. H7-2]|uniref:hypothetical protein n=1 Tax=Coleofasciculus sp. H7-2 TaxID=3351545 RepID=UPI0036718530